MWRKRRQDYGDPNLLYFSKSDVNYLEGFQLAEGVAVTFQVYVDNKGVGAFEVSPASLLTPADEVRRPVRARME